MQKGRAMSKGSSSPAVCVIPFPHELQKLHFVHEGCQWQGPVQEEHSQREGRQCLDLSKQPHEDKWNCSLKLDICYSAADEAFSDYRHVQLFSAWQQMW